MYRRTSACIAASAAFVLCLSAEVAHGQNCNVSGSVVPEGLWRSQFKGYPVQWNFDVLYVLDGSGAVLGVDNREKRIGGTGIRWLRCLEPAPQHDWCPSHASSYELANAMWAGVYEQWCAERDESGAVHLSIAWRHRSDINFVIPADVSPASNLDLQRFSYCPSPHAPCDLRPAEKSLSTCNEIDEAFQPLKSAAWDAVYFFHQEAQNLSRTSMHELQQSYNRFFEVGEIVRLLLCSWCLGSIAPSSCWGSSAVEARLVYSALVAPLCRDAPQGMSSSGGIFNASALCELLFEREGLITYTPREMHDGLWFGVSHAAGEASLALLAAASELFRSAKMQLELLPLISPMLTSVRVHVWHTSLAVPDRIDNDAPAAPNSYDMNFGRLLYPARFTPKLDDLLPGSPGESFCERLSHQPGLNIGSSHFAKASFDMTETLGTNMDISTALFALKGATSLSGMMVNLGASDGTCAHGASNDPVNCLLVNFGQGFAALLVEAEEKYHKPLEALQSSSNATIELVQEPVTVFSVLDLCRPALQRLAVNLTSTPALDLDLVKVDIDGDDLNILHTLIWTGGWRPKLIHLEFAAFIPPPLEFVHHGPSRFGLGGSLAAFANMLSPLYTLVQVEFINALFVRSDLADRVFPELKGHSTQEKWASGFWCHPLRTFWGRLESDVHLAGLDPRALLDPAVGSLAHKAKLVLAMTRNQLAERGLPDPAISFRWLEE